MSGNLAVKRFEQRPEHFVSVVAIPELPSDNNKRQVEAVFVLGAILIALQVLDALLTYLGLATMGISAEGNPILQSWMHKYGVGLTLAMVKAVASFSILGICCLATRIKWIVSALKGLIAVYFLAAILPWCYIVLSL